MLRFAILLVGLAVVLFGAVGCRSGLIEGSGRPGSQTRRIGPVTEVVIKALHVTLVQRDAPELRIEGDHILLPYVEAVEEARTLTLGLREDRNYSYTIPLTLTLFLPRLEKLTLTKAGSGSVRTEAFSGVKLELNADWGTIHLHGLHYKEVTANLKQLGRMNLSGTVEKFTLQSDFPGETMEADDLKARMVEGMVTDSEVTVWATDELKLKTGGLAKVKYRGQPRNTGDTWGVEPLKK